MSRRVRRGGTGTPTTHHIAWVAASLILSACASGYHADTITGGFSENQASPSLFWVGYAGNSYTNEETVQSYWLYRCTQITLEHGYDGFEIVTPVSLSFAAPARSAHMLLISARDAAMERYSQTDKPQLSGEIRLLKRPFTPEPGRVFDAAKLQAFLAPYVTGPKCGGDNVCPHVHRYLFPPAP